MYEDEKLNGFLPANFRPTEGIIGSCGSNPVLCYLQQLCITYLCSIHVLKLNLVYANSDTCHQYNCFFILFYLDEYVLLVCVCEGATEFKKL